MELTRRDALLALASGGIIASMVLSSDTLEEELSDTDIDTLVQLAEVLYPSVVEPSREFIKAYVVGRYRSDGERLANLKSALRVVQRTSRRETGKPLGALDIDTRDKVLRATGGDRAYPDPSGTDAQRVRYYIINDLLYAFYTTPKGGRLVGNRNPKGYPGGVEVYQQEPDT
ncbi:gluconate 2-dehydrogenase subunit 3 family protein [Salinigranum halophilum]|uniref:gluconate 2-dehydrogenase subunit 3 family protein n=1 Tax=Salinigranum halophilum TaxID=2565931 RepID=UPI0010A8F3F3|nr:gluconate 2-dehydrogenase subunit 3 family protein [Salinigranum halophilum]